MKKPKYRQGFLDSVKRYADCNTAQSLRCESDVGLAQLHAYESCGLKPQVPDPYFTFLLDGKKWWEWTLNNYLEMFDTGNWPGFYLLALDFRDDPEGYRQLRQRMNKRFYCDVNVTPEQVLADG